MLLFYCGCFEDMSFLIVFVVIGEIGSIFDIFVFVILEGIIICIFLKLKWFFSKEKVFLGFIFVLSVNNINV